MKYSDMANERKVPGQQVAAGYVTRPRLDLIDSEHNRIHLRPTVRRALTALLRAPDGLTTDALLGATWPHEMPAHPRRALETTLSRLRAVLPPACLHRDDDRYRLVGLPGPGHVPAPFIGRDPDLHLIRRLLRTHDGVLVTGPAGIGRSRLIAEAAAAGIFGHSLRSANHDVAEIVDALVSAPVAPFRVVLVDDVHLFPSAALDRLRAVADVSPTRFVMTVPDGVKIPGSVHDALIDGSWTRVALGALADSDADALAEAVGLRSAAGEGNPGLIVATTDRLIDVVERRLPDEASRDVLVAICATGALTWSEIDRLGATSTVDHLVVADLVDVDVVGVRPTSEAVAASVLSDEIARRRVLVDLVAVADTSARRARWALAAGAATTAADHSAAAAELLAQGDPDGAEVHAALAFSSDPGPSTAIGWLPPLLMGSARSAAIAPKVRRIVASLSESGVIRDLPAEAFLATLAFMKDGDADRAVRELASAPEHELVVVARCLLGTYTGTPNTAEPLRIAENGSGHFTRQSAWAAWFLAASLTESPDLDAVLDRVDCGSGEIVPALFAAMRARGAILRRDWASAHAHLDSSAEQTSPSDLRMRALLHMYRSEIAWYSSDAAQAIPSARRAADLLQRSGHLSDQRVALQWLALALASAGRFTDARTALDEAAGLPRAAVIGDHLAVLAEAATAAATSTAEYLRLVADARAIASSHGVFAETVVGGLVRHVRPRAVDSLTARELEIGRLVARRLTSREIADRLNLSRRTVENHTANAYRKLGINSRRDLPNEL